ncbi:hypothetical protein SAMN04515679_0005 [Pelosinus fermentans]|uniref:hypothetical protein n=1 Tax=Pelosinus fermentans TaxID=365349 RepID=UPI0007D74805|nr:hypothetical protein [Pelosinus fermentans]OAM91964.1 hypothetical protein FR7_04619 [Pelosinus fermentans DSM 17108]SDQ03028.1 hypothetical protein SAMN04515679_0005 [Pelosinus fermentans]
MPDVIGAAAWKFIVKTVVSVAISTITIRFLAQKTKVIALRTLLAYCKPKRIQV